MLTEQEQFWSGDFGRSYTERNRVNWQSRIPFWEAVLDKTKARSVLEVGCNAGWNLHALREINSTLALWGVDVNTTALDEACDAGFSVLEMSGADVGKTWPRGFDLVFSAGCLIHVPPAQLESVMRSIIDASRKYVLAVEYADEKEVEVSYRGHSERLWRRPFGDLYTQMGLKLIKKGEAGEGFDRCHYWLLSR